MKPRNRKSPPSIETRREGETLYLKGSLTRETVPFLAKTLTPKKGLRGVNQINIENIAPLDKAGASFMEWLTLGDNNKKPLTLDTSQAPPEILHLLEEFTAVNPQGIPDNRPNPKPEKTKPGRPGLLEKWGGAILEGPTQAGHFLLLLAEIVIWSLAGIFRWKDRRKSSVMEQCWMIGVQSLPLVALLSGILGLILALQSAIQLKTFGANIFVADLMAISMVTEMGPMMTAILIAGRSGSSIASEVATMKVSEEIDALKVMGLNPISYIIVPKFLAMTLTMPLLVIFSIYLGVGGGVVVGYIILDIAPAIFAARAASVVLFSMVIRSLAKSILFGWMIVVIGSHFGFSVSSGSEEVGIATTKAVVYSIISVIFVDALFSLSFIGGA